MLEHKSTDNCVQSNPGVFLETRVIVIPTLACVSTKTSLIFNLFHRDVRHSYNEHLYLEPVQIMCLQLVVMHKPFFVGSKNVVLCERAEVQHCIVICSEEM